MRLPLMLFALLTSVLAGCAGYQIGSRTMFRPDVSTVHVPIIRGEGFRRFMGERLTEAVVKRVETVTPYKVVSAAEADTILEISLAPLTKRVLGETRNDDPRDIEIDYQARLNWVRCTGEPLIQPTAFPFATSQLLLSQGTHFVPEGGQSISSAEQVALDRLAAQIVEQMELSFPLGS
ncbi:LPS assembly lipoprotein LptE [Lignipirellula cremea]|uniref:Lipopolysaccharide-assembly n=1 Tax=Lignipirellula cremea TaxID=2528010 RepID=A0A518DYY9_9BACT|nr:LPS assembly lipoprotein LptE [Lignipirellula cremea]QDU97067.1 hypothetical protein Pla8534_48930 [Lignipirellula cremea]